MGLTSALDSLEALTVRYEGIRIFRRLLVRRLVLVTSVVLAAVVSLQWLPWAAFVAVALMSVGLVAIVLRAERRARERCRACAIEVASISRIPRQTDTRPTAR